MRTAALLLAALGAAPLSAQQPEPPQATYWVYVANESSDLVSRVRFGPDGITEEKTIHVGIMPADLDGAHGLSVAPDGRHWYVSLAHGTPFGRIWKFSTGTDELLDSTTVGLFPASMAVTPDGSTLFVVNFNLHGNPVPSSVSAIFTPAMQELTKIETCVKPHGSALNHAGSSHYSVCVGSEQLVEISTLRLQVTRRLDLTPGREHILSSAPVPTPPGTAVCGPTWVAVSPDDRYLYVPCNRNGEVLEISTETFAVSRRLSTGKGPYNADVSPDGRYLLVTLKGEQAVAVFDLTTGAQDRVPTTQPITHGVVVTPDSRYAFVSNEAIGATRATVDVIDLGARQRIASVEVQHQAGGIDFWRMEPEAHHE